MQRGRCACSRTPWRVTLPKLWGLRVQSAANVVSASSPAKRRALSGRICWPVPADRKQQLVPDVFYIPWKLMKCSPSTTLRTGWDLTTALDVFLGKIDHHSRLQHAADPSAKARRNHIKVLHVSADSTRRRLQLW